MTWLNFCNTGESDGELTAFFKLVFGGFSQPRPELPCSLCCKLCNKLLHRHLTTHMAKFRNNGSSGFGCKSRERRARSSAFRRHSA